MFSPKISYQQYRHLFRSACKYQRTPFSKITHKKTFEERNRLTLKAFEHHRLKLAQPFYGKPDQYHPFPAPIEPTVKTKERKLVPLTEAVHNYNQLDETEGKHYEEYGTYYDPLFNPHLYEERHKVNPEEEPFNAIYSDSKSPEAQQYTKAKNITTPELWDYVERLARIKVAPKPKTRKQGEPITPLPSGLVPPPETPPDLPYFIPRTRNYLLPVYYYLAEKEDQCTTMVIQIQGDLWQFEHDLRTHLESLHSGKRILTSVREPDARVLFKGKHLHQIVDWLHSKGF